MGRRKKAVPAYRLHAASGQAVVVIDGRAHYLGVYGSDASRAEYARLIAGHAAGVPAAVDPSAVTVAEVLAAYYAHAEAYYVSEDGEPTNQVGRVRRALAPVRRLYGQARAAEFGPRALKAVRQTYVDGGHCRDQVNKLTRCVVAAWRWAAGEEMVTGESWHALRSVEPLKRGRTPAPESEPVRPVPRPHVEAVLKVISPVLADAIRVQLLTGSRPGEVLRLRAEDLEARDQPVWLWRPARHKTRHHGHAKTLYVGPQAQAVLLPYLGRHPSGCLFRPADSMALFRERQRAARKTRVQPSQQGRGKAAPRKKPGERYHPTSYARAVATGCRRAGVPHWHPHQLRHSAATWLLEAGVPWDVIRVILGHRSLDVTRMYAEDDVARAAEFVRRLG